MHVRRLTALAAAAAVAMVLSGCEPSTTEAKSKDAVGQRALPVDAPTDSPEIVEPAYSPPPPAPGTSRATPRATAAAPPVQGIAAAALLYAAAGGDGDSWKDTGGREYRMGLINTPEQNECYGGKATTKRKELVAHGFRAKVYATDDYGRRVTVISLPDGTNLNIWLARHGYADDKYLATYRHENPTLAAKLDTAFAAAKRDHAGLWGACSGPTNSFTGSAGTTGSSSCHPDYATCIPVKGDGSGNGFDNDLDCPDIGKRVTLRQVGVDPYRLDSDGDGLGCDSYG